jgi:protein involved in polysaccharide export with SLBB domain
MFKRHFIGSSFREARWLALGALLMGAFLISTLGGCKTASTVEYKHAKVDLEEHLKEVGLGPGDVFELRVYGEKELTGVHRISPEGQVDVPLIGRIDAEGLTPGDIGKVISNKLREGYIRDPFVSIYVKEYNSKKIFVLGEVAKPGTFPFKNNMTVVEAITLAGGFKSSANKNYVVVTRKIEGKEQRIEVPVQKITEGLATNLPLNAGDIVFVHDRLL